MSKFCMQCGTANPEDSRFCEECGAPFAPNSVPTPPAPGRAPNAPARKSNKWILFIIIPVALFFLGIILFIALYILPNVLNPSTDPEPSSVVTGAPAEEATPVPEFELYGIETSLEVGVPTNYFTRCDDDATQETVGVITVDSYERVPVTEEQIAFGNESGIGLTGYERLSVHFTVTFAEENALRYGASALTTSQNYYNDEKWRDNITTLTDSLDREFRRYEVDYNGETQYVYLWYNSNYEETDYIIHQCEYIVYVPAGYDGVVVGVANAALPYLYETWYDEYIYEHYNPNDYLLFRMK